jgi:hypothetical protein
LANAGGTGGGVNSGNRGVVTVGTGTIFGAHALMQNSSARKHLRIKRILPDARLKPSRYVVGKSEHDAF